LQPSVCVQPQCSARLKNCLNDLLGLAAAPGKRRACRSAASVFVPAAASALTGFEPELLLSTGCKLASLLCSARSVSSDTAPALFAVLPCDSSSWVESSPGLVAGAAKENLTLAGVACTALGAASGICKGARRRALPGTALPRAGLKAEPAVALPWAAWSSLLTAEGLPGVGSLCLGAMLAAEVGDVSNTCDLVSKVGANMESGVYVPLGVDARA